MCSEDFFRLVHFRGCEPNISILRSGRRAAARPNESCAAHDPAWPSSEFSYTAILAFVTGKVRVLRFERKESPYRPMMLLDLVAAAAAVQLLLDRVIFTGLAQVQNTTLVLLLKTFPGDTVDFGLFCAFGMGFALIYRAFCLQAPDHFKQNISLAHRGVFVFGTCMLSLTVSDILKVMLGRPRPSLLIHGETYEYHFVN